MVLDRLDVDRWRWWWSSRSLATVSPEDRDVFNIFLWSLVPFQCALECLADVPA